MHASSRKKDERLENFTPPLEEFGDTSGMSISNTTTAKSWKGCETIKAKGLQPQAS